jgi:CBS domain-containing protein
LFSDVKQLMSQNKIWDLPVVDNKNKLLGLIHMSSLLK